jgi:hypothetical protein
MLKHTLSSSTHDLLDDPTKVVISCKNPEPSRVEIKVKDLKARDRWRGRGRPSREQNRSAHFERWTSDTGARLLPRASWSRPEAGSSLLALSLDAAAAS